MLRRLEAWLDGRLHLARVVARALEFGFPEEDVREMRRTAIRLGRLYPSKTAARHAEVELWAMLERRARRA